MQGLQIWNEQAMIRVSRDARLTFRLMPDGEFHQHVELQEGSVEVTGIAAVNGLLHHAMPCLFESLVVRVEGIAAPVLDRAIGQWPTAVDDELEIYPHLHFLEERKTGMPWRLERWYTLAGRYLILDSEQYFERPRPVARGKNWERLIVQLRQVVDLAGWDSDESAAAVYLLSTEGPRRQATDEPY